jgi:tetratricopeptide (TPR) repeat protein
MGLLDRLIDRFRMRLGPSSRTRREGPGDWLRSLPSRPEDIQQQGENSPIVVFRHGKTTIVLDRDAFDYAYPGARGPDPSQRDLDAVLPGVTRVCVLGGAMVRGRAMGGPVLFDIQDPAAIRDLAIGLRIVEKPSTFGHCQCLGGPTIELYSGLEHVATLGIQHGRAIRWKRWYHDAQLRDGNRLNRWLHDHGVDPRELAAIYERGNAFLFGEWRAPTDRQRKAEQLASQARERAQAESLDEALTLCTRALQLDPDSVDALGLRGQVHYHSGRLPEAADDCDAAIRRGARYADLYHIRAMARDDAGHPEEALADCSLALHIDPAHLTSYNVRGSIRARLGQLDEALADFAEAIRLAPEWPLPYMNRGNLYQGRAELDRALSDYDRAVELVTRASDGQAGVPGDPTRAYLHCRRGEARYDLFREQDADADFAEAARHQPAATGHYLGEMWMRRGKCDRALGAYSDLIRQEPGDARAHLGRGAANEAMGELEQAAADYSTLIGLAPEEGPGYILRARIRHLQGRPDDALADLSEHLRIHPDDTMSRLFRYTIQRGRKAWAAACEELDAADRMAPDDPAVWNCRAWMMATCPEPSYRDGPRAIELARRACEATQWQHSNYLDTLAAALADTGAWDEAVRWQTESLRLCSEEERPARQARLELYQSEQPYRE